MPGALPGPALWLIDGHSYAYRAFYGLPALTNRKGQPTQAVYGFAVFLLGLLRERKDGEEIVVAFDPPGPTFRHEALATYKAQRKPTPDDLVSQFPLVRELVSALGVPAVEQPGFEADDVLATLAVAAEGAGRPVVIYSGDKDILQLVNGGIRVAVPRREDDLMDADAVRAKWGVSPGQIADLLALMGDTSDNLPGVPGVGEKTAALLLSQFGSITAMYERLGEVKSEKLREKLAAARSQVLATRELAVLRTDVPVPGGLAACAPQPGDPARARTLFEELDFNRLLASLPAAGTLAGDTEPPPPSVPAIPAGAPPIALADADAALVAALSASGRVAVAAAKSGEASVLAFSADGGRWTVPAAAAALGGLAGWLADPARAKVTFDAKAVARAAVACGTVLRGVAFDVRLAAGLLDARDARSGAEDLSPGPLLDALAARAPGLEARIEASGLTTLLREVELPVAPILAEMEARGIRLDRDVLAVVERELAARLGELKEQVSRDAGPAFNPLSPKQVGELLFRKLNLPAGRKTKTGYSTDEAVLDELSASHPVPGLILEIRKLSKLLGTYLQPLPALVGGDGLLHTTFHQLGAATGRLSSSDPNLQNIPVRGPTGRRIRAAFVARSSAWRLLSADYSQIELRILAHVAADEAFLEAFRRDEDIHAATAGEMFGRPAADVTPDQRRAAKAVNFGIMYGMTAYGLARELKCEPGTAREYLDRYFLMHPAVKRFWDRTLAEARIAGFATTLFGRRRPLPELASANKVRREEAEREAINHPIQGTAADFMKLAIARSAERVPDARLLLTIHDELLFEVPRGRETELAAAVRAAMEGVHALSVPLKVEADWGDSWADCHG